MGNAIIRIAILKHFLFQEQQPPITFTFHSTLESCTCIKETKTKESFRWLHRNFFFFALFTFFPIGFGKKLIYSELRVMLHISSM